MSKSFNTTGVSIPEKHYMVNLDERLKEIKKLVDDDCYFVINRACQYGKTTTLRALYRYLQNDYYVVLMDSQAFGNADFDIDMSFSKMEIMKTLKEYEADHNTGMDVEGMICSSFS